MAGSRPPGKRRVKGSKMTEKELQFVLSEGEGLFVEFKERPDKSLAREMTAFANASGGKIFIGVSDDSRPLGIQTDNRIKSQLQDTARNCDPPVPIKLDAVGGILVVEIPESLNKPHSCSDGFFMRIGANCQKLNRDEIFSMGIRSGKLRFDEQACEAFDCLSDIDEKKVSVYLRAAGLNATLPMTEMLANLEVLSQANGKLFMTNAGALLFAKTPRHFLKSSPVVCAVYQGEDKAVILDRKIYDDGLLENIEGALTYLKRHMDVRLEIRSLERTEVPQYPDAAVREAVVNAVMHRDYFDASGDLMVEVFRNRITVSNPGGLVPWLRPEDFGKYSRTRNRLLASMLMRTPYAEKMGTGIFRINQALTGAGLPEAAFRFDEFSFSITLRSSAVQAGSGSPKGSPNTADLILKLIQEYPRISTAQIGMRLGISKRAILKQTNGLKQIGRLRYVGPARGGHWEVLS